MSLVDRAAKRLEQRKVADAREELDAAIRPSAQDSLIERAVRKLESLEPKRSDPPPSAMVAPASALSGTVDSVDQGTQGRREPRLAKDRVETPGTGTNGSSLELDLSKLAAAGYVTPADPESTIANELRRIKRPLIQACQGKLASPVEHANRIMITSALPGEGKSFVALNLALSMAMERDSTVLLIDADTTRSSVSELIGVRSRPGLMDVLSNEHMQLSDVLLRTNLERLTILPAGMRGVHATEWLASEAMGRLVESLSSSPDRILIFDTPPLLAAAEAAVLAGHMGQTVVVVEAQKTTHHVLRDALTTIETCPVVSLVLNKARGFQLHSHYYAG